MTELIRIVNAERFIALADLRERLGLDRAVFDAAFAAAYRSRLVSVARLESVRGLTRDHAARLVNGCLELQGEQIGYALSI